MNLTTNEVVKAKIEALKIQITDKKNDIVNKKGEIENFEIDQSTKEEQFCEMLDETNEGVFNMLPSTIMQKCDPIMFSTELSYYVDSLDASEETEYKELEEELEELEEELEELEEELEEAEEELEE